MSDIQLTDYTEENSDLFYDWFRSLRIADVFYSFEQSVDESFGEEFKCAETGCLMKVKVGVFKNMGSGNVQPATEAQIALVVGNGYLVTEPFMQYI